MDQNKCAHLEIKDLFSSSKNPLEELFALQRSMQQDLFKYDLDKVREHLGDVKDYLDINYHAIQDEFRELYNALGGVNSHGSAIWKRWKSKHEEAKNKPFNELTEEELKELRMEVVDIWHFMINISLVLDMDAKMVFNYYQAKNLENKERQKNNY